MSAGASERAATGPVMAGPRAATSLFVWGWYLTLLGAALLLAPNAILTPFGLPPTEEVWIRVVGMFTVLLAHFSFSSARTRNLDYMRWSVQARFAVPLFFIAFVLEGWVPAALIAFGLVDVAGASWTWWALRRDAGL